MAAVAGGAGVAGWRLAGAWWLAAGVGGGRRWRAWRVVAGSGWRRQVAALGGPH